MLDIRKMTGREGFPTRAIGGVLFEERNFRQKSGLSKIERNDLVDSCPYLAAVTNEHHLDGKYVSPLKVLSAWILNNRYVGSSHAIRRESVCRCILAWNSYRAGKDMKHSRYFKTAAIPEAK